MTESQHHPTTAASPVSDALSLTATFDRFEFRLLQLQRNFWSTAEGLAGIDEVLRRYEQLIGSQDERAAYRHASPIEFGPSGPMLAS